MRKHLKCLLYFRIEPQGIPNIDFNLAKMAILSQGSLERLNKLTNLCKTVFHWGFVPTILYLGFAKGAEPGMPELTLAHLFWAS